MKIMRHFLMMLIGVMVPILGYAANDTLPPFNQIVFFGDSLSDNGNLYRYDFGYAPKSPPYHKGRFSNGRVWSEILAEELHQEHYTTSLNEAIGGQTTVLHNLLDGFSPYILNVSIKKYLLRTYFTNRSRTLFVIWAGANDYFPVEQTSSNLAKIDTLTSDVMTSIREALQNLITGGGVNFLVVNLPNLSLTPYARDQDRVRILAALTKAHNEKMIQLVEQIRADYKHININMYDVNQIFTDIFADMVAFNQRHQINLKNIWTACWQGDYKLMRVPSSRDNPLDENKIATEIDAHLKKRSLKLMSVQTSTEEKLDAQALAHAIATTPTLAEAYLTTEAAMAGERRCSDERAYLFWDRMHPTTVIHQVLANEVKQFIERYYKIA